MTYKVGQEVVRRTSERYTEKGYREATGTLQELRRSGLLMDPPLEHRISYFALQQIHFLLRAPQQILEAVRQTGAPDE